MALSIPQTDPRANYRAHAAEIDAAVSAVLDGGHYILGEHVSAFEQEFAAFLGMRAAVGVGSGTDALHIALRACGLGAGDKVVTVSHTAVATVAAIELAGAVPLFADINPQTFTLDLERLEESLEKGMDPAIKAVVVVHLYGQPVDMPALMRIAQRFGLRVIEDCAQAHGAEVGGRRAGAWGDVAAYSFYPTKNLGALGDGGAIATNDAGLDMQLRLLREYGWRERYVSEIAGMNSRLDELQAAILRVKLRHLDAENARRRAIAGSYRQLLVDSAVILPWNETAGTHVYHQFVVRSEARDALRSHLRDNGVGTLVHYPVPVHLQPAYKGRVGSLGDLRATERAAREILSLPMFPELSDMDVARVAQLIKGHAPRIRAPHA